MITLITGVPGAGKTLAAVKMVAELDRQVYSNVRGLKIPHTKLDSIDLRLYKDGSVLLIDECQQYMRGGKKIPDDVIAQWETHRHRGIDIYLTSQAPSQISKQVMPLIGKHFHYRLTPMGERQLLEWDSAQSNPVTALALSSARRRYVKLDRKAMGLYSTSEDGIPPKILRARRARWPWVILACFVGLFIWVGFAVYKGKQYYDSRNAEPKKPELKIADILPIPEKKPIEVPKDPYGPEYFEKVRAATELAEKDKKKWEEHFRVCKKFKIVDKYCRDG